MIDFPASYISLPERYIYYWFYPLIHVFYTSRSHAIQDPCFFAIHGFYTTVDGRNPANQLRLVVYPIIYKVLYIPGSCLGCLPSSVVDPMLEYPHVFAPRNTTTGATLSIHQDLGDRISHRKGQAGREYVNLVGWF